MEVNELRIGNLTEQGIVVSVSRNIVFLSNENAYISREISPLLLTEGIKQQFGNDKLVLVDKLGFVIFKNGYNYNFVFEDYPYIHQLQNLYFALTGEELILSIGHEKQ